MAEKYSPEFVKEILDADKEPVVTSAWCLLCEEWLFHDDPPCQNIDCPYPRS